MTAVSNTQCSLVVLSDERWCFMEWKRTNIKGGKSFCCWALRLEHLKHLMVFLEKCLCLFFWKTNTFCKGRLKYFLLLLLLLQRIHLLNASVNHKHNPMHHSESQQYTAFSRQYIVLLIIVLGTTINRSWEEECYYWR